jgi:hypothetical protein
VHIKKSLGLALVLYYSHSTLRNYQLPSTTHDFNPKPTPQTYNQTTLYTSKMACCGRNNGTCVCAQEATCSCGKQPALQCSMSSLFLLPPLSRSHLLSHTNTPQPATRPSPRTSSPKTPPHARAESGPKMRATAAAPRTAARRTSRPTTPPRNRWARRYGEEAWMHLSETEDV